MTITTKTNMLNWGGKEVHTISNEPGSSIYTATKTTIFTGGREQVTSHDFTIAGGVPRWTSNGRVVPMHTATEYGFIHFPLYNESAAQAAREAEIDKLVREYKKRPRRLSSEQRAEMRAEFGPGATVVDVISGQRFRV